MLEAINLTKRYGNRLALDSLNLRVAPGELFCLLGSNGAGKTTAINIFLNFVDPTQGSARIDDVDVTIEPLKTKERLAYIPEQVALYRNLTAVENMAYITTVSAGAEHPEERLRSFLIEAG